jgi:hypothetical protein
MPGYHMASFDRQSAFMDRFHLLIFSRCFDFVFFFIRLRGEEEFTSMWEWSYGD